MCKNPERAFIKGRVETIKEARHFLSNACKRDREVWVVAHFLSQPHIKASEGEIQPSSDEPADVVYREAGFQVKEILDEGRKRGDEYKESLRKAENATSASEFLEEYRPKKTGCRDLVHVVAKEARKWTCKYGPSEAAFVDLLWYFNLQDTHIVRDELPEDDPHLVVMKEWRSVSVCAGDCALVLGVSEHAPSFLKEAKGKIYRNRSS